VAAEAFPYDQALPAQIWPRADAQAMPDWPGAGPVFTPFITAQTRIVSAGSCFAHSIAAYLQQKGFAYLVTETGPPWLRPEQAQKFQYGVYSARYGPVYGPLQFWQLVQRAWGQFSPQDDCWAAGQGWVDPFRPRIQPGGFVSPEAMRLDREHHLAAVREAFAQADLLILTLGLTECWRSCLDGAVYPQCPGKQWGVFDSERYVFHNLSLAEIEACLSASVAFLAEINPKLRWILTLSPVPLAVTAEPKHVLEATGYSKALLRVAIENLCREFAQVDYFPAYELVMHDRQAAFAPDGRQVLPETVAAIMQRFENRFVREFPALGEQVEPPGFAVEPCDEELLLDLLEQDFGA